MPISVICNGCGKEYRVADAAAGKKLRCRACGQDMLVPRAGAAPAARPTPPATPGGDEDPFEALVAMEQKAAPAGRSAPAARRPSAVIPPAEPIDVDDEPSRPKEKRHRPPGRFGRRSSGGIGTDSITPWLVIAFIVAQIAAAILQTVQASHVPAHAHGKVVGLVWTAGLLHIGLLFALLGPAVFLGVFISSKVLNYRMVDLGYLRGCAIAALPGLILLAIALIPNGVAPQSMLDAAVTIGLLLSIPITFLTLRFVFDLDWVGAAVAYLFSAPLYFAAASLATGVVTAALLTQLFGSASVQPTHFYDRDEFARVTPSMTAPASNEQKKETSPANTEADLTAKKSQTEENLRQIGQAAQRFAGTDEGKQFPPTLEALVTAGDLPADRLTSPFQASKSGGYTYLSGRTPAMPGSVIIAYDDAERASQGGTHVLFANGTVEWRDASQVATTLAQSDQALGEWQSQQREAERKRQEEMLAQQKPSPNTPAPEKPVEAPPVPKPEGFVGAFEAGKSPLVASVAAVPIEGDLHAIIATATPSPFAAVVRSPMPTQDQIEIWDLAAGQKKGEASFAHEAGFQSAYAINPVGTFLARTVNFPKLEVRVWSIKDEKETKAIPLNGTLGTPTLAGFMDAERVVVRWTQGELEGLQIWNVITGKMIRQVPLQPYTRSANNGVFSPDGRTYAFTTSKVPPRPPRVGKVASAEFYDLVSTVNWRRPREITEVAAEDVDSPAGMAFSPDGRKLAALYVKQGLGVVVIWRVSDTKPLGSYEVAVAPDAVPANSTSAGPGLAWAHNGAALLIEGNTLIDANSGKALGLLNAPPSHGQRAIANDVLAYTYDQDGKPRIAVVKLAEAKAGGSTTAPTETAKH
jgi:hypothetical protein